MHYYLAKSSDLFETLTLRCQYRKSLDLQLAIHGVGLRSLNSQQIHFLNYVDSTLKSPDTELLISEFIPEIDFASLQMIISHPRLKSLVQPDILLNNYQIPASKHVYKTLERSIEWSDSILTWFMQKKIKPHEISFLNLLSANQCVDLLNKISESALSKMDSLKTLEMASELLLMKVDLSFTLVDHWTEKTIAELAALRFPMSLKQNPIQQVQLKWPKNIAIQSKRVQDKMGFQIQFFASHPEELNHTLTQLEKMVPDWSEKLDRLDS